MKTERLQVALIYKQDNRLLLYGANPRTGEIDYGYHLIAPLDATVEVGDWVNYEPYGANFGWFVEVQCAIAFC